MRYTFAGLFLVLLLCAGAAAQDAGTYGSVSVAGVDIAGLTRDEAHEVLQERLDERLDAAIHLTDGQVTVTRARRDLSVGLNIERMLDMAGGGWDFVPLQLSVDGPALVDALKRISDSFHFPGKRASIAEQDGAIVKIQGQMVRRLDVPGTADKITDTVQSDASQQKIQVVLNKQDPPVKLEDLQPITGRLSQYITRFNPREVSRTNNMRIGIEQIHGTLMPPGSVFSLNTALGERTRDKGYEEAPIFVDREIVPGLGGGVSQVTGTLFNAALLAGLEVVEYRVHTRPVDYIPLGRDATVAWGSFDMKFRNSTDGPVYIDYRIEGNRAIARLYGKKTPGQKVDLNVVSQRLGPREIRAKLYRTITVNGEVVRKERVGISHYKWEEDNNPNE